MKVEAIECTPEEQALHAAHLGLGVQDLLIQGQE